MPIINVITHPVMVFLLNTIIIIYYYDKITKCPLLNLKTNNFTLNFLFWNKLNNDNDFSSTGNCLSNTLGKNIMAYLVTIIILIEKENCHVRTSY